LAQKQIELDQTQKGANEYEGGRRAAGQRAGGTTTNTYLNKSRLSREPTTKSILEDSPSHGVSSFQFLVLKFGVLQ
jgi:hypothetical protein